MKVNEILLETTDDDIILLKIAKEAMPSIRKAWAYFVTNDREHLETGIEIGTIGDLSGLYGRGAYNQLLNIPIFLIYDYNESDLLSGPYYGEYRYDLENKSIYLNTYPLEGLDPAFDEKGIPFKRVMSTLVHEMRHAYDEIISEYKAKQAEMNRTRKMKRFSLDDYAAQKSEVGARYTEAIKWIQERITPDDLTDSNKIKELIKNAFDRFRLTGDKRSLSRAYQFIMSDQNHSDMIRYHPYPENEK